MITIKDFMEIVEYRITEGSEYCWSSWESPYTLDSWNGEQDGYTVSITFNTKTQEVYVAQAYDYKKNKAYRLFNPLYEEAYRNEALVRGVNPNEATEEFDFIDLESESDFIEKAKAIAQGLEYDDRVTIALELDRDMVFELMKLAHEQDITLNELVSQVLQKEIERLKLEE
jgi:predicted HicB family RNase H-like nuclease